MFKAELTTGYARTAAVAILALMLGPLSAAATEAADTADTKVTPSHGMSAFGDLKYKADFKYFDYVSPDAPKGGTLRLAGIDSFDSLNPFILKGVPPQGIGLLFESLMTGAGDEPDAVYGLLAQDVRLAPDRSEVTFSLRPAARWNDGTNVTAADVVFSFKTLVAKGHPQFRILYRDFEKVEALDPKTVRFRFKKAGQRDLPLLAAEMPVFSKAWYSDRKFDETSLVPPMGSGPYRVDKVEPGRSISYRRDPDYWGRDLPVNRGRNNFDVIRWDYYRDRDVALQAFFAGEYDFREEFTSRDWATRYTTPHVKSGAIKLDTLKDQTPSGVQAFFFNLRREKFKDPRVREALGLAFDFEWTNKNLFYGLYDRMSSMFENSSLAAKNAPTAAELKLLEPLRGKVPDEVFTTPYTSPKTTGPKGIRGNLRRAVGLLRSAGWRIKDRALTNVAGEKITVEFLLFESSFTRIINPYIQNLKRLGVDAKIRIVDVANFKQRTDNFDFDIVVRRFVQSLTPGIEQANYFGSQFANVPGSPNLAGIANPAVDAMIEKVINAKDRTSLHVAVHALDRVLMWNHYAVPQWYKGVHHIAYWDRFGRPKVKPAFELGMIDTWWVNAAKAANLDKAR